MRLQSGQQTKREPGLKGRQALAPLPSRTGRRPVRFPDGPHPTRRRQQPPGRRIDERMTNNAIRLVADDEARDGTPRRLRQGARRRVDRIRFFSPGEKDSSPDGVDRLEAIERKKSGVSLRIDKPFVGRAGKRYVGAILDQVAAPRRMTPRLRGIVQNTEEMRHDDRGCAGSPARIDLARAHARRDGFYVHEDRD